MSEKEVEAEVTKVMGLFDNSGDLKKALKEALMFMYRAGVAQGLKEAKCSD